MAKYVFVMFSGQRPQFVAPQQQQQQLRQVEPRLLAPSPQAPVLLRNAPSSYIQAQPQPIHQIPSVPQQPAQIITVAAQTASFPGQPPAPQSQLYTGVPAANQAIISPQQPPLLPRQANFPPSQNFVSQQPGVNIVRPLAGGNAQPLYRNVEPFAYQRPPNQTVQNQFLQPQPSGPLQQQHPNQPMIPLRLPQAGDRSSFDGNIIRAPMSSQSALPGHMDFGVGEPNPVHFNLVSSNPEMVGQPIETVIHNRNREARPGVGRATSGFGQNKTRPFLGVKWVNFVYRHGDHLSNCWGI